MLRFSGCLTHHYYSHAIPGHHIPGSAQRQQRGDSFLVDDDAHATLFQTLHERGSVLQAYLAADFIGYFLLMQADSADQLNRLLASLPLAESRDQIRVDVQGLEPLTLKSPAQA